MFTFCVSWEYLNLSHAQVAQLGVRSYRWWKGWGGRHRAEGRKGLIEKGDRETPRETKRGCWLPALIFLHRRRKSESESSSVVSDSLWPHGFLTSLSMGFSRQEHRSGLPFPSPWDLPHPGIKPGSPHCRQILYPLSHQGGPLEGYLYMIFRDTKHLRRRQILGSWVTRSCHMTPSGQCDGKGNFVSRTEVNFLLIYLPPASGSHCRCNGWSSAASLCPEWMLSTGKLWARNKDGA